MRRQKLKLHYEAGRQVMCVERQDLNAPAITICLLGLLHVGLMTVEYYRMMLRWKRKTQDYVLTVATRRFAGGREYRLTPDDCIRGVTDNWDHADLTNMQIGWLWNHGVRPGDSIYVKLEEWE